MTIQAVRRTENVAPLLLLRLAGHAELVTFASYLVSLSGRIAHGMLTAEGGFQAGHRAAMLSPGLVGQTRHAQVGGEKFFDQT